MPTIADSSSLVTTITCACANSNSPEEVRKDFTRRFNQLLLAIAEDFQVGSALNISSVPWSSPLGALSESEYYSLEGQYKMVFDTNG